VFEQIKGSISQRESGNLSCAEFRATLDLENGLKQAKILTKRHSHELGVEFDGPDFNCPAMKRSFTSALLVTDLNLQAPTQVNKSSANCISARLINHDSTQYLPTLDEVVELSSQVADGTPFTPVATLIKTKSSLADACSSYEDVSLPPLPQRGVSSNSLAINFCRP